MSPRLHEIMPKYHVNEIHEIDIDATPTKVWEALWAVNFNASPVIKSLTSLRGIWRRRLGIEEFARLFPIVYRRDDEEVVMHATMRSFWGTFTIGWNFHLETREPGCTRLITETRVLLPTRRDLFFFRLYWLAVEPHSRWIRRIMLRMIRDRACSPTRW